MNHFEGKTENLANMKSPYSLGDNVSLNLFSTCYMPSIMLTTHHKCTFQQPSWQKIFTDMQTCDL